MTNQDFIKWRNAMGWTQSKTAAAFEKNIKTIARYERGETAIPAPIVMACTLLAITREDSGRVSKTLSHIKRKYGLSQFNG